MDTALITKKAIYADKKSIPQANAVRPYMGRKMAFYLLFTFSA
ncbi:hypothetical protein [Ruminococcus sp.]